MGYQEVSPDEIKTLFLPRPLGTRGLNRLFYSGLLTLVYVTNPRAFAEIKAQRFTGTNATFNINVTRVDLQWLVRALSVQVVADGSAGNRDYQFLWRVVDQGAASRDLTLFGATGIAPSTTETRVAHQYAITNQIPENGNKQNAIPEIALTRDKSLLRFSVGSNFAAGDAIRVDLYYEEISLLPA